jgi:hypothetical protein
MNSAVQSSWGKYRTIVRKSLIAQFLAASHEYCGAAGPIWGRLTALTHGLHVDKFCNAVTDSANQN